MLTPIGSDWDGWCHGDYVPFRFQMSHWKSINGDYVPLLSWNMKAGNDSLHTESSRVPFKFSRRRQCRIHVKIHPDHCIGRLNYFCWIIRVSELQWHCLMIEVRFQKMYGFSIVISIDSLIIQKACKCVQTTCWTPPLVPLSKAFNTMLPMGFPPCRPLSPKLLSNNDNGTVVVCFLTQQLMPRQSWKNHERIMENSWNLILGNCWELCMTLIVQ